MARQTWQKKGNTMSDFKWRDGYPAKIKANIAGRALSALQKKHGRIDTAAVLDAARPETAPLHPAFEWDDDVAGEKWRLHEARNLIRAVVLVKVDSETGEVAEQPHVVSVRMMAPDGTSDQHYLTAEVAVQHADEWESAIALLYGRIQAAARALDDVKRIAAGSANPERMAMLMLATESMATARQALQQIQ